MAAGYYRRQETQWLHTRELIAATFNASANRDFKRAAVKGRDIIQLSSDGPPSTLASRYKVHKKERALMLTKKQLARLNKRFQV